ncbi:hypothetical protein [Microbacterium sp. Se5.02b]|uniref:hypothetical protein n=1 Tax=Microbacterium sp. Se5.02b TaxID=2864103 RepID=UPI00160505B5|nr:hypothetical protein [Microbacterium sp. Se5.02b]QNA93730.1 hypothetical protein G4G29_18180 [Microbacterium sp. Se63.02b]QYM64022.1 hypothetical protein K1X59_18265 [Microbacterium sp. Se5.02b]
MNRPLTTHDVELGPIDLDWTIIELLEWLSRDDARQHDVSLQHPLARIEAALTGENWSRTPSTVALIRALTLLAPAHGSTVIADILFASQILPRVA